MFELRNRVATSNTGPLDALSNIRSPRDCADDLEASVNAEYRMFRFNEGGTLNYPSQKRKYDQDMESVNRARNLLCSSS